MKELLMRYKELTLQQIDYLEQNNYEDSLRIVEEKNHMFLQIQQEKKMLEIKDYTEDYFDKQLVAEIINLNEKTVKLMETHKLQISYELSKLKISRQIQGVYGASYSENAYYFDRVK